MTDILLSESEIVEVLLVEDSPRDAELAMRAIKKYNLANHIVWVKDGAEALEFIFGLMHDSETPLNKIPHVVLLDLKMPKIDGHEVLRRIKEDPRTKAIPVVVLTSSQEEADLLRSYQSGANSYVVKPLSFESFMDAVRQLGMYWLLLNKQPKEYKQR